MDWMTLAAIAGIMGFFFNWLNGNITRLDTDVKTALLKIDATNARLDLNLAAINARLDVMGERIDATQAIIMRMLEKQGK